MTRITVVDKNKEEVEQPTALKYVYGVEGSFGWIRSKLDSALYDVRKDVFDSYDYLWVKDVFYDTVIIENEDEEKLYEATWEIDGDGNVVFGDLEEVTQAYVKKSREEAIKAAGGKLEGRFVKKDKAKQLAYGYVMIPGEPDSDGDVVTDDKIEEVAHKFIKKGYHDLMHEVGEPAAELAESWIEQEDKTVKFLSTEEEMVIPKGSWGVAVKIHDDVWPGVEDGTYKGFSIMAVLEESLKSAKSAKDVEAAMKRVTLKDLEEEGNWGVDAVSIVDDPAVGKALFFATKTKEVEKKPGLFSRMFGAKTVKKEEEIPVETVNTEKSNKSEGDLVFISNMSSKSQESEVRPMAANKGTEENASFELNDLVGAMTEANKQMLMDAGVIEAPKSEADKQAEAVAEAVKAVIDPVVKRIEVIEESSTKSEESTEEAEGEEVTEEAEEDDESESQKRAIKKLEKQIAALKKGSSKSLLSDDDEEYTDDDEEEAEGRNAQGIRVGPLKEVS